MSLRLGVVLMVLVVGATARGDPPAGPRDYKRELRRECDLLLSQVVKRPYGWGWATDLSPPDGTAPATREPVVSFEPLDTPAAALLLLHASQLLNEPAYAQAAQHVGRLAAASVQSSGQIPSHVALGAKPLNRERPGPVPDRSSTRAAMALLLSLIQGKEGDLNEDELLTRAAGRGAAWLMKQQAPTGAWPVAYPPGADPKDVTRLVRLDTPDTRDNLLAMLLAYEVLGEESHRRSVERSIAFLMKVRNGEAQKSGAAMYGPAFDAGGAIIHKVREFPPDCTDCLASRYSIQAVFAAYVVMGNKDWSHSASVAAAAVGDLPVAEPGKWHRWYTPRGQPIDQLQDQTPTGVFGNPTNALVGDWGLPSIIQVVQTHDRLGRERFVQQLRSSFTIRQRLALTVNGLIDETMALDLRQDPPDPQAATTTLREKVRKLFQLITNISN